MAFSMNSNYFIRILILLVIIFNFIKLSIQAPIDIDLINRVKSLQERAKSKKEEYSKYKIPDNLLNVTNFTEYDNITNIAIFLNKTGISHLKKSVTNQRTSGIKKEYINKYLESIAKRFEFTEEIKQYFNPLIVNITEKDDDSWKNYELMYKKNSTNTTLFICILAKNLYNKGKLDFIINQVELEYKFSNFLLLKINTCDKNGKENDNYKYIKTDIEKSVTEDELKATHTFLSSTGYDSLAEFLEIKDEKNIYKESLLFLQ